MACEYIWCYINYSGNTNSLFVPYATKLLLFNSDNTDIVEE